MIVIAFTSVALVTAQDKAAVPAESDGTKGVIEAIGSIGSVIAGAGEKTGEPMKEATATASTTDQKQAPGEPEIKKPRSAKNSVILITGGAAAGAALGAALGKDPKYAMIGAAMGGVAGLIYDRATHKNPGKI